LDELVEWQSRPLDPVWPVLFLDAIYVKIRDGKVSNRPIYVAMGINAAGERDVLGMWVGTGGESCKHWAGYLTELANRGINDVMITACDGLPGLPEAIETTWPQATVQTCVVYLIRGSLRYASKADWAKITKDLKAVSPPRPSTRPKRGGWSSSSSGVAAIRRSSGCGNDRGSSSRRFWTSPPSSASSSTQPTRLRRSTRGSGKPSGAGGISRTNRSP
jgi:hypothetical protein